MERAKNQCVECGLKMGNVGCMFGFFDQLRKSCKERLDVNKGDAIRVLMDAEMAIRREVLGLDEDPSKREDWSKTDEVTGDRLCIPCYRLRKKLREAR